MPAPLNVNREAVRVLVLSVGVREAARQMGLGESTVQQWSARGRWLAQPTPTPQPPTVAPQAPTPSPQAIQAGVTNVTNPAQSLANYLKRNGELTRSALSRAARKGATALAAGTPNKVLRHHKALQSIAAVSGKVDGWAASEGSQAPSFTLNLALVTGGMQAADSQE